MRTLKANTVRVLAWTAALVVLASTTYGTPCTYITGEDFTAFTGSVSVLDTGTLSIVTAISVGDYPKGVALTPDGRELYVVNGQRTSLQRGDVSVIDTATEQVSRTVKVGMLPNSVAVSPDGHYAYVLNSCGFDSSCSSFSAITVIDTVSKGVVGNIFSKETTSQYDTNCSSTGIAVSPDGLFIYAACMGYKLLIISVEAFLADPSCPQCAIVREVTVRSDLAPSSVSFSPDGALAYVAARSTHAAAVGIVDAATQQLTGTVPLPATLPATDYGYTGVVVVATGNRTGYVTHPRLDALLIDFVTKTIAATVPLSLGGRGIAFDASGETLILTQQDARALSLVSTITNTVIPGVQLPTSPFGVTVATSPECPPQFPPPATATSTFTFTAAPTLTKIPMQTATPTVTATQMSAPTATSPPTQTLASTATPTLTITATSTYASSPTATQTPAPTAARTPTATPKPCFGDCNGSGEVTVNELITLVNIALGNTDISTCAAGDANGDGEITVNEIVAGVNNALNGCPRVLRFAKRPVSGKG